jgi:hypothetical protein
MEQRQLRLYILAVFFLVFCYFKQITPALVRIVVTYSSPIFPGFALMGDEGYAPDPAAQQCCARNLAPIHNIDLACRFTASPSAAFVSFVHGSAQQFIPTAGDKESSL